MEYAFKLGHQPHISAAEIKAVFSAEQISYKILEQNNAHIIIDAGVELNTEELMNRLGGTIKILKKEMNIENPEQDIAGYLKANNSNEGKIQFSLSGGDSRQISKDIKEKLKEQGCSVRFIEPKNTATIINNKLVAKKTDLTILKKSLFVTVAVQKIDEFSRRDYGRPRADDRSGMLPPKLARIMINLSQSKQKDYILDPFCGSGTIMMEAVDLGFRNVTGSDSSVKAVEDSGKNINWLLKTSGLNAEMKIMKLDARYLSSKIRPNSIDSIITEPYLGRPLKGRETKKELEKQSDELAGLYIESFKSFNKIMKKGGTVIFIIPKFKFNDEWITVDCADEIKKAGFNQAGLDEKNKTLVYCRPGQKLAREIFKFTKA